MDKIKRGLLVSCFLVFLCPLAVTAMPYSEMTVVVTGVDALSPPAIISVAFPDGKDMYVEVNENTEVDDSMYLDALIGKTVKIEALNARAEDSAPWRLIALEVFLDDSQFPVYEYKGKITGKDDDKREIMLFGSPIWVPPYAEIKNINEMPIIFENLVEGPVTFEVGARQIIVESVVKEIFEVTEIKEIEELECTGSATHIFKAHKPANLTHKTTEHYCQSDRGKLDGRTLISFTDYTGEDVSSYTVGKYVRGDRHGYWLSIDVTGNVIRQCRYNKGRLVDGDELCPVE